MKYHRTLELETAEERMVRYGSKDFPNQLERIGKALKDLNVERNKLVLTLNAGGLMIHRAQMLSPWDWGMLRRHSKLQRLMISRDDIPLDTPDDDFFPVLRAEVEELAARKSKDTADDVLRRVD